MQWWKWVGLAGMAGVAATGAVIARDERKRNAYSADEVRARLHDRAEEALAHEEEGEEEGAEGEPSPT
jgi:hypothetical protein